MLPKHLICAVTIMAASLCSFAQNNIVMYNGRPGARFVLHLYPGADGYIRTSSLGQPHPSAVGKRQLIVLNQPEGGKPSRLPLCADARVPASAIKQQWGLQQNSIEDANGLSLTVISPYQRERKFNDSFPVQASTAPLFLLRVTLRNNTDKPLKGRLLLGMDRAHGITTQSGMTGVVFDDLRDGNQPAGGELCLATGSDKSVATMQSPDMVAESLELPYRSDVQQQAGIVWNYLAAAKTTVSRCYVLSAYNGNPLFNDPVDDSAYKLQYTKWWSSAAEIAHWGVRNLKKLEALTDRTELASDVARQSSDTRMVISQGVAEFLATSHLVTNGQRMLWMNSEAGFSAGYLSTVDLIPDTFLFHQQYLPWTLPLLVELHSKYLYEDALGSYITHDVGGSTLEIRGNYGESGAGHRMPVEENCNYIHLLWMAYKNSGDPAILKAHTSEMVLLLDSFAARDANGDGIPDTSGNPTESNTYDNGGLIGNTRNSSYLGIKTAVSCYLLAKMLSEVGRAGAAARAMQMALTAQDTLVGHQKQYGYFHTVMDASVPNHQAPCLWTPKGLFTLLISGTNTTPLAPLVQASEQHVLNTYEKLKATCGFRFDGVPTYRGTWQSQSIMMDILARQMLGQKRLGVATMMANSMRISGLLNEFVGSESGLASDTEWPAEQLYSRMPASIGWLPGVVPAPVTRPAFKITLNNIAKDDLNRWRSQVLPAGRYYVKLTAPEQVIMAPSFRVRVGGTFLVPAQPGEPDLSSTQPAMLAAVVDLPRSGTLGVNVKTGANGVVIQSFEVSDEPTTNRVESSRPAAIRASVSKSRLRSDGQDSLELTAMLTDIDGRILKLDGVPITLESTKPSYKLASPATQNSVQGKVSWQITAGTQVTESQLRLTSGKLQAAELTLKIGGSVNYRVDTGRSGGAAMDSDNNLWLGDSPYQQTTGFGYIGTIHTTSQQVPIANTADPKIFQTDIWSEGTLTYRFDTYEPGDYTVKLLFAETFFGTDQYKAIDPKAARVFTVSINDKPVIENLDVYTKSGGSHRALVESFTVHIDKPEPILVKLIPGTNNPNLCGIELCRVK